MILPFASLVFIGGKISTFYCIIGFTLSLASTLLLVVFGEASFTRMTLNGPYQVGYREFRTTQFDNEVSVFYPISKEEHRRHINDPGRNT